MTSKLRYMLVAGVCAISALMLVIAEPATAQVYTVLPDRDVLADPRPEPEMPTYQHYPIFQSGTISPRIMIVLDNSISMNYPAYGVENEAEEDPNGKVIDTPYGGLECTEFSTRIKHSYDDGQEQKNTGQIQLCNWVDTRTMLDLDLGRDDDYYGGSPCNKACACQQPQLVGLRFSEIRVPREVDGELVTINSAYIELVARENEAPQSQRTAGMTLTITAHAADHPAGMTNARYDISDRPDTTASVVWEVPAGAWEHKNGSNYTVVTPNLAPIVQELVSRPGWRSGNAMFFKIDVTGGTGGRPVHSFDSNTQLSPRLIIDYEPCRAQRYYGYFNPYGRYSYSNMFYPDPNGQWNGNFLNWLCMRRGDVLRKALAGGLSTSRTGTGPATQIGINDIKASPTCDFVRHHDGAGVSPWGDAWYFMTIPNNGVIQVRPSKEWTASKLGEYVIQVAKDPIAEPNAFGPDGELAGVFQKIGDRAQWGDAWFMPGTDLTVGKAQVQYAMDQNITNMTTTIKNTPFNTETPIAEALYVVTQYFKHVDADAGMNYHETAIGPFNNERDPFYNNDQQEDCAGAYCLLLTDGMSEYDQHIPDYLKDYADSAPLWFTDNATGSFAEGGSDYAKDVALYMRTTDLRSATVGRDDLEGEQNVILYVVYALGNNPMAETLLKNTAINGGFYDRNGNDLPDLKIEWDENGDGVPDNYFHAKDGDSLEDELMNAILAILKRAGSGTAVSVLATKGEGEGTLVQAIFNPAQATEAGEVAWTGMLHSLWVDDYGMVREDTDGDYSLDTNVDERILFDTDASNDGETVIKRYHNDEDEPYETVPLSKLKSLWSGGRKLAETEPTKRKIYTYWGPGTEADPSLNYGPVNSITDYWNMRKASNFLGVNDTPTWDYLGISEHDRGINLFLWIAGAPHSDASYYGSVELRNRTLDDGTLWKLGDIIHSTPTSMAQPLSDYDLMYGDQTYYEYYMKYRNRETVVFVGSNDGMLHAFTGWAYRDGKFVNPYEIPGYFNDQTDTIELGGVDIGKELWAYIPQAVLPHLKWLPRTDYTHVNYIDLRPRVFDARIFTPSDRHPNGWGTVLVCGMGFAGGMKIECNPNHPDPTKRLEFNPSFFAFDVTHPRAPVFMWERNFPDFGMTSNYPNLLMVDGKWMLAIGSGPGPLRLDGKSDHDAKLAVIDLKTGGDTLNGGLKNIFTLPGGPAFTNEAVGFDKNLNYNADSVIVAANYNDDTSEVFRLTIPQKDNAEFEPWDDNGTAPDYVSDPADPGWTITKLFKSMRPITASASMSIDRRDNSWIYLGTGRYLSYADKTTDAQNYIIGIKDPFFNSDLEVCNYSYPAVECEINASAAVDDPITTELFDADDYTIFGRTDVDGPDGKITFDDMLAKARDSAYSGWFRRLQCTAGEPSERVINKGAVLGGIVLKPTFTPNSDICGFGGTSRLFAVFYETGTAFFRKVFLQHDNEGPILDVIDLGDGLASSLSIHSGRQTGGKVYVQKSTGEILEVDVDPAFKIKSGPEYWLDDGYY